MPGPDKLKVRVLAEAVICAGNLLRFLFPGVLWKSTNDYSHRTVVHCQKQIKPISSKSWWCVHTLTLKASGAVRPNYRLCRSLAADFALEEWIQSLFSKGGEITQSQGELSAPLRPSLCLTLWKQKEEKFSGKEILQLHMLLNFP